MLGTGLRAGQWRAAMKSAVLGSGSMHRPVSSVYMAVFALVGLACSEDPPPYFADGTFSGRNTRGDTTAFCNYLADP